MSPLLEVCVPVAQVCANASPTPGASGHSFRTISYILYYNMHISGALCVSQGLQTQIAIPKPVRPLLPKSLSAAYFAYTVR